LRIQAKRPIDVCYVPFTYSPISMLRWKLLLLRGDCPSDSAADHKSVDFSPLSLTHLEMGVKFSSNSYNSHRSSTHVSTAAT
jgi:hypothetical protein